MRKIILATAFVLTSSVAALAGSFTAQVGGETSTTVGGFQSFAQCQAYVSGVGGTCIDNGAHWSNAQARYVTPVKSQTMIVDSYNPHKP